MTTANAPENRLPRLLALVPYFLAHPGISIEDAAAELGVTPKQLRKDIDLLIVCGMPGYGPGDMIDLDFDRLESGYVEIWFDANLDRPLRLTAKEALSLAVALQTLADTPGLADREVVSRTLAKIEAAYGAPVDDSTLAVEIDRSVRFVPLLHRAVDERRALALSYYTAARDETSERVVDPLQVLTVGDRTYLQAWCRQAEGVRLFRADRIDDARLLDEPARPPEDLELPELVEGVFRPAAEHALVTLQLAASYAWVADYYLPEEVVQTDGGLRLSLRVSDTAWVRGLVLGAAGEARVLKPQWLAQEITAEAAEALAAYQGQAH